ncbi:MAG: sugar phosphate isomerase/epimerase family protein [Anaerolineales bacterium]
MLKIAMTSYAMEESPYVEALMFAVENGFDAFEVNVYFPAFDLDNWNWSEIEALKKIIRDEEIEISVHAAFYELNMAAFLKEIREESVRYINKSIDFCHQLGGEVITVHPGKFTYEIEPGASPDTDPLLKIQWDHNIESLKRINAYAESKGITLCLENLGWNEVAQSFEDLLRIRDEVGDTLQFTLDIGHARIKSEGGIEEGFRVLGDNIRHIHLSDNYGKEDDHLPIGEGNTDFSNFFHLFNNFPHIITLEIVPPGPDPGPILKSLAYLRTLERTLGSRLHS